MKHFRRIADGFDIEPCLAELGSDPPAIPRVGEIASEIYGHPAVPSDYRGFGETGFGPATLALLEAAYRCLEVSHFQTLFEVQDPMVLACPPGARVSPHRDHLATELGRYFFRFQLAIQCDYRAYFRIGLERARFKPGELWLCDVGDREHEMRNYSDRWRIVLRFDARPVDQSTFQFRADMARLGQPAPMRFQSLTPQNR